MKLTQVEEKGHCEIGSHMTCGMVWTLLVSPGLNFTLYEMEMLKMSGI